jgi:hypothetical protein
MKGLKNEEHDMMGTMAKIKLILVGANVTYLISTLAHIPNSPRPYFPGAYGLFLLLTIANLYPIGLLLLHSAYQLESIHLRAGCIFSFLGLQWVATLVFRIELVKSVSIREGSTLLPIIAAGVILLLVWKMVLWKINQRQEMPETIFP